MDNSPGWNKISLIKDEGELDKNKFDSYNDKFINYLSNDLNTANAITLLYDLIKDDSVNGHTKLELIKSFDMVFSLDLIMDNSDVDREMETYILGKIEERREAKLNKNYELSDSIRAELLDKGIELIDTREGTTYKIIK